MSQATTVVIIDSPAGWDQTWLTCVIGSMPGAVAIGAFHHPFAPVGGGEIGCCRVHGRACRFWSDIHRAWGGEGSFFEITARETGRHVLVVGMPSGLGIEPGLIHQDLSIKSIHVVRDGRSIAASLASSNAGRDFEALCREDLAPAMHALQWNPQDATSRCIRLEDFVADRQSALSRIASFIGIECDVSALRFWEHEHHLLDGEQGVIDRIRQAGALAASPQHSGGVVGGDEYSGLASGEVRRSDFDRWRRQLSDAELCIFDAICGHRNAEFGYERDRFTAEQWQEFGPRLSEQTPAKSSMEGVGGDTRTSLSGSATAGDETRSGSVLTGAVVSAPMSPSAATTPSASVGLLAGTGLRRVEPSYPRDSLGPVVAVIVFGLLLGIAALIASGVVGSSP